MVLKQHFENIVMKQKGKRYCIAGEQNVAALAIVIRGRIPIPWSKMIGHGDISAMLLPQAKTAKDSA